VAGGLALQRLDDIAGNVPDQKLGHRLMLSYDSGPSNGATSVLTL
jgi:hypothetical protein